MTRRGKLYLVNENDLGRPLTADEVRLNEMLVVLDQLRRSGPITEETARWAREELAGGMLGELIANPRAFRWITKVYYAYDVLWGLLCDLAPEVLEHKEVGRIDSGLTVPDLEFPTKGDRE